MKLRVALARVGLAGGVTAGRLVGTLALFACVARASGPEAFAAFGYWYAISVMIAALTEYGFAQQLLSELPSRGDRAARQALVDDVTGTKLWLVLLAAAVALPLAMIASGSAQERWFAGLLVAAALVGSLNDLSSMLLRALGAFRADAWSGSLLGLGASLAAGGAAMATGSLIAAAGALLVVRLVGLMLQLVSARRAGDIRPAFVVRADDGRRVVRGLRSGVAHGVDNLAIQLMLNADVLACRLVLDPLQAGLYLSANRLSHAAHAGVPLLVSVFLPSIAAGSSADGRAGAGAAWRQLLAASLGFGLLWNGIMWGLHDVIAQRLFGAPFAASGDLLGPMAIAIALRYLSLVPAVRLVVAGRVACKAAGAFVGIAGLVGVLVWLHGAAGPIDARQLVLSLILANMLQTAWLAWFAWKRPMVPATLQQHPMA